MFGLRYAGSGGVSQEDAWRGVSREAKGLGVEKQATMSRVLRGRAVGNETGTQSGTRADFAFYSSCNGNCHGQGIGKT